MRLTSDEFVNKCWSDLNEYLTDIDEHPNRHPSTIVLALKRYLRDQHDSRYEFRVNEVDKVFKFFSFVNINAKGDQIRLLKWQLFFIAAVFGFYHRGTNKRKYQKALVFVARKNGKTTFLAALQVYLISGHDERESPYSLLVASTQVQASIASKEAAKIIGYSPMLRKRYMAQGPLSGRNKILCPKSNGLMETKAADFDALQGLNPSSALLDETHTYKDSDLYDATVSGTMVRENPIVAMISTAGYLPEGFCAQMVKTGENILKGEAEDESFWFQLYKMDAGDDKLDPKNWHKPNPSVGDLFKLDVLIKNWDSIKAMPISKRGFITLNLNEFVFGMESWINEDDIEKQFVSERPDWVVPGIDMYVGFDLSQNTDLTAVSYLWHSDGRIYVEVENFMAANNEKMQKGSIDLRTWINAGLIHLCSSRVIDYEEVLNSILEKIEGFNVVNVRYDQYNSNSLVSRLQEHIGGTPVQPLRQYGLAINQGIKFLERSILQGEILMHVNPVLKWNYQNVVIKENYKGSAQLGKNKNSDPIDSVVALLMSVCAFIEIELKLYDA